MKFLIRAVLIGEDEDWTRLIPKSVREELAVAPSSAADAIGETADLLDRASLKHLINITLSQWRLFEPILREKAWVQVRVEELREARNALVHGYQPDADYKVRVAIIAAELGKRIPAPIQGGTQVPAVAGRALQGRSVLWVDDRPEGPCGRAGC